MHSRNLVLLGGGLVAAALLLAAIFWLRPIQIQDGQQRIQAPGPALTVGQALARAGIQMSTADQVTPGLARPIPWDRTITITRAAQVWVWDKGEIRPVTGLAGAPSDLLAQAGLSLHPGDRLLYNGQPLLAWEALPDGKTVVLQIERDVSFNVDVDGETRPVTSSAPSYARALWDAGIQTGPADRLSIDPAQPPVEGAAAAYLAAQALTIQAGDHQVTTRTTAATVGQALAGAGLPLQGMDYSIPAEDQPLPADGVLRVTRVHEEVALQESLIPYGSKTEIDPNLELDTSRVTVAGQYGVKVTRERVRYEDGQETQRSSDSEWVASQPVDQTLGYGTQVVVKTLDVPGGPIEYYRAVQVYATSYSPCRLGTGDGRCGNTTASGARLDKGIIAVRLSWYRMFAGQRVYVPGYGFAVIGDVGGGMPDRYWIDLGFSEDNYQPIVGWTTLYFLTPVPASVPWALP